MPALLSVCIKLLQEALCWPQCSVWGSTGRWGWQSRMASKLPWVSSWSGLHYSGLWLRWEEQKGYMGTEAVRSTVGSIRKTEGVDRESWKPSQEEDLVISISPQISDHKTIHNSTAIKTSVTSNEKKKQTIKEGSKWERWWVPYLLSRPFPRSQKSSFSQVQWSLMLHTGTWGLCNMSGTLWQLCVLRVSPVILNQNIYFASFYVKTATGCWTI